MNDILSWFGKEHLDLVNNEDYKTLTKGLIPEEDEDIPGRSDIEVSETIDLIFNDKKLKCIIFDMPVTDAKAIELLETRFIGISRISTRNEALDILGEPSSVTEPPNPCPRPLRDWGGTLEYGLKEGFRLAIRLKADKNSVHQISVDLTE